MGPTPRSQGVLQGLEVQPQVVGLEHLVYPESHQSTSSGRVGRSLGQVVLWAGTCMTAMSLLVGRGMTKHLMVSERPVPVSPCHRCLLLESWELSTWGTDECNRVRYPCSALFPSCSFWSVPLPIRICRMAHAHPGWLRDGFFHNHVRHTCIAWWRSY
jgi:hypothetical protein